MKAEPLLKIDSIQKRYPVRFDFLGRPTARLRAVDGVSFEVRQGETLGLVGESGCGKTTLGRCILRLEEPTGGSIRFEDQDVLTLGSKQVRKLRRNMQMIFQDPYSSLNPRKTVGQLIADAFVIHGLLTRAERQRKVQHLLGVVGLRQEHAKRYPHEFSGGQRQRIGVARALALNPKLIVADEPVSALDVSVQAQIINLLVKLQGRFNLTYIFISHDLSVIRGISDRVAVMYLGKIVEIGQCRALFQRPLHPYTEALISAVPVPDRKKRAQRIILQGDVPSPLNPPSGCNFHPRCPYRQEKCVQQEPQLEELLESHRAACFFPRNMQT